jgi:hypothetical protein
LLIISLLEHLHYGCSNPCPIESHWLDLWLDQSQSRWRTIVESKPVQAPEMLGCHDSTERYSCHSTDTTQYTQAGDRCRKLPTVPLKAKHRSRRVRTLPFWFSSRLEQVLRKEIPKPRN